MHVSNVRARANGVPRRRSRLRTAVALGALTLLAQIGLAVAGPAAHAAETACANRSVTDVKATDNNGGTSFSRYGTFRVDVTFAEQANCQVKAGDSFTVTLPAQFRGVARTFDVLSPDGQVVGTAVVTGRTITMTYSDYVSRFPNVRGTLFASSSFSGDMTYNEDVPVEYTTSEGSFDQVINARDVGQPFGLAKTCAWTDDAQTTFQCDIRFPQGPQTGITITDTLGAGAELVPGSIGLYEAQDVNGGPGPWTKITELTPDAGSTATQFTLTIPSVDGPYNRVVYSVTPTVEDQDEYTNTATFESSVQNLEQLEGNVERSDAGGEGQGDTTPLVDIRKDDAQGNAADTAADVVDLPDGSTGLVYTITNTGTEALEQVVVSDTVVANGTVAGLTCDFSPLGGPATGTTWAAGPFEPGKSFTCTAQLSGVEEGDVLHQDIGTVTGIGVTSGEAVKDTNGYFATRTPTAIDSGEQPGANGGVVPTVTGPQLAATGATSDGVWTGVGLLVVGTGLAALGRRRTA